MTKIFFNCPRCNSDTHASKILFLNNAFSLENMEIQCTICKDTMRFRVG